MTPEGKVKRQIKDWLVQLDAYIFSPVQTGYGERTLDLLCCIDGRFVGIEVKRPGVTKASKHQDISIARIRAAGGVAFVAQSLEDVVDALDEAGIRSSPKWALPA